MAEEAVKYRLIAVPEWKENRFDGQLVSCGVALNPPSASLLAQLVKNLPAVWETQVWLLGGEDSPGEGNGNPLQYSGLENSVDKGPGGQQSMGLQRVRHNWAT